MSHPLSTGLVLLIQTTLVAVAAGTLNKTFWFSYILFLIFLGGMLVLFIYVASLSSNEQFSLDINFFLLFLIIRGVVILFLIMIDPVILRNKISIMITSISGEIKFTSNTLFTRPIYNSPSAFFTFFIIRYLLLALLIVVKIMNSSSRPLRLITYENTHPQNTPLI